MSVKNLEKISDMLETGVILHMQNGIEQCDTHEVGEIIDMIKDLAEAKYKCTVTKAMEEYGDEEIEEAEDGEDWKKWYSRGMRARDSRGRYMSRHYTEPNYHMTPEEYHGHTAEELRQQDHKQGRMYYSEMGEMSRYDHARKNYTEGKASHPTDEQSNLKAIETLSNTIMDDIRELLPKMSQSEKTMLKQKMNNMSSEIM